MLETTIQETEQDGGAMTAEKALAIFKNEIYASGKEKAEAMKIIEEAVEKQIAKKVEYESDTYDNDGCLIFDIAYCPSCEYGFDVDYDNDKKYCPDCGQKLDWSVEE